MSECRTLSSIDSLFRRSNSCLNEHMPVSSIYGPYHECDPSQVSRHLQMPLGHFLAIWNNDITSRASYAHGQHKPFPAIGPPHQVCSQCICRGILLRRIRLRYDLVDVSKRIFGFGNAKHTSQRGSVEWLALAYSEMREQQLTFHPGLRLWACRSW